MVNVYPLTKFEVNILINNRDMAKNPKSNMAVATILNFRKSVILCINYTRMANVDLHTKFGGNQPRNG